MLNYETVRMVPVERQIRPVGRGRGSLPARRVRSRRPLPPDRRRASSVGWSSSEQELAHRFAAGEQDALQEVYALFAGPVYTVALSRLGDPDLAEEAVQDVFVKAWRATARFDADRRLRPWLYEIARRAAADIARRERRHPATTALSAVHGAVTTHGEGWERWQVKCALQELSPEERELMRLTHYEGLTRLEIADRLGIPLGTVKSRLHRTHRRLAGQLAHLRRVVA